jgi:hypothetical protein
MQNDTFEYEPIENLENWGRDPRTGLLCNFDEEAIEEYREWRDAMEKSSIARGDRVREQKKEQQKMKSEVDGLKDDVSEIKSLLKDLVQGLKKDV